MQTQKKYCYPENIVVQHIPVKEKVKKKQEGNPLKNEIITDTLTSVNTLKIVKVFGTVDEIYEVVLNKEKIKYPLFRFARTIIPEKNNKKKGIK